MTTVITWAVMSIAGYHAPDKLSEFCYSGDWWRTIGGLRLTRTRVF